MNVILVIETHFMAFSIYLIIFRGPVMFLWGIPRIKGARASLLCISVAIDTCKK